MEMLPSQREPRCGSRPATAPDDDVRARVWTLLGSLCLRGGVVERRRERRYPFPYLVRLVPVARDGISPEGKPVVVVGRHLSQHGLDFFHRDPLPYRRMIATLETALGQRMRVLVDLGWCRFTGQGWYESGGRFLRCLPPLPEADVG